MNGWQRIVLFAGLAVLVGRSETWAETPEPMPAYCDAQGLRIDASLRAVAFNANRNAGQVGIACGDRGTILRSEDGGNTWKPCESDVDCTLCDVVWVGPQRVVIVGGGYDRVTRISRGVVLTSHDAGLTWQRSPDRELPRLSVLNIREDGSITATGDWSHSLLTRELESHNGGRTWVAAGGLGSPAPLPRAPSSNELLPWVKATGFPVAVRDACRVNDAVLCAVGDHGVILRSSDQGQQWQAVRGDQRRTAILMVARDPASVPWSLLGSEALENRNRVSLLLAQSNEDGTRRTIDHQVANQVAVMLGGSGVDTIEYEKADIQSVAAQWIAVHRPAVLVLGSQLPPSLSDAFFHAAAAGGVRRVVVHASGHDGRTTIHRNALLRKTGVLASDLAADAMQLVAPHRKPDSSVSLRYIYDAVPSSQRGASVVEGVSMQESRRLAGSGRLGSRRKLQIAQARLRQSDRIQELMQSSRKREKLAESFASLLDQTAKDDQFRLIWSVLIDTTNPRPEQSNASRIHRMDAQQVVMEQLVSRFPQTSAARWAQLRLESMKQSVEWRRLRPSLLGSTSQTTVTPAIQAVPVSPFQVSDRGSVRQVSALSPVVVPKPETHDLTKPASQDLLEVDLAWEFHPLVLLARDATRRRGGDGQLQVPGEVSADLDRLVNSSTSDWLHLAKPHGQQVVTGNRAVIRPKLDGFVDDECWQQTLPSAGRSPRIRVAYDDDYVYFATQVPASRWAADEQAVRSTTRTRDHELTNVDRMSIRIDVDRDLLTSMQLQVSEDGRTYDAIDGIADWQPTWYVDTRRDEDSVVCEVAILRRDLVDLPINAGESWLVSATHQRAGTDVVDRIVPVPSQWVRVEFQP